MRNPDQYLLHRPVQIAADVVGSGKAWTRISTIELHHTEDLIEYEVGAFKRDWSSRAIRYATTKERALELHREMVAQYTPT